MVEQIRIIMKAQFLKIAKVKTEKQFYAKYPTEAAFFKAHPEAKKSIKKAQMGAYIGGDTVANPEMINYRAEYDAIDKMITGYTDAERRAAAEKAAAAKQSSGGGGGMDLSGMMKMFSSMGGGMSGGGARYGNRIPRAAVGVNLPDWAVDAAETATDTTTIAPNFMMKNTSGAPYANNNSAANVSPYTIGPQTMGKMQGPGASPGNYNSWDIDNNGIPDTIQQVQGNPLASSEGPTQDSSSGGGGGFDAMKGIPIIGGIIGGIQALEAEKEAKRGAEQAKKVSDITLKASGTRAEEKKRRYVTPWDNPIQPDQMFPTYGVGTNVLARDGVRLQGGGEIQNTYAPGYLYDDLGYEPLNDSNVKQYYHGGGIPRAQYGLASAGGGGFGENPYGGMASGIMGNNNAGSQIGGSIGSIFGPVGGFAGSVIGGMLDTNQHDIDKYNRQTKANIEGMAMNNMIPGIHSGYRSHLKDGGYMNPEYNPQVIARFGELDAQDFAEFAHQDEFRAGGHLRQYRNPSEEAMQTYKDGGEVRRSALNGQVQTTWGGGVRTLSHNPYMPSTGETIEFVGNSHDKYDPRSKQTGIGVKYGQGDQDSYTDYAEYGTEQADANVEVEKEPAAELIDPKTGEKNLTVYGNLKIPNQFVSLLGDDKAKGKKFKHYVSDLSKQEERQNKIIATSTNSLNDLDVKNSFDRLKLSSLEASINGANMKLKTLADRKIKAADIQNAINDTAEEYGIVADDLARGKFKIDKEAMQESARYGKSIPKAQNGLTFKDEKEANDKGYYWTGKFLSNGSKEYKTRITKTTKKTETSENANALGEIPKNQKKDSTTGLFNVTPDQVEAFKKKHAWYPDWDKFDPKKPETVDNFAKAFNARAKKIGSIAEIKPDDKATGKTKYVGEQFLSADFGEEKKETPEKEEDLYAEVPVDKKEDPQYEVEGYKRNKLADLFNQILPFIRPSDQEAFDYAQLYPEMNALATNQLEPVQAQGFQPDLATPYDISYQDQLNANQADYNSMQKMVGYNPAAQGILNAQKYSANEKVLGEQFRANQAMQAGVYDANRQTLNNAKLKNLDIFDRQYGRQAEALSNTKATTQAALNSISDKIAKNKLENKTLGIYENLYNYRYDNKGRAINMNPLFQPNMPYVYGPDGKPTHKIVRDSKGNVIDLVPIVKEEVSKKQTSTPSLSSGPIVAQGLNAPIQDVSEYTPYDQEKEEQGYIDEVAPKKNGGKVKNKYVQSSIVRGFK